MNYTQLDFKFEASNDEKYKVDSIRDSVVYAKELTTGQLLELYNLILWKSYPDKENTWEPASAIQYL